MSTYDYDITIDDEFAGLLPSQSKEESEALERNILAYGLLSPLVVWAREDEWILVDGHNRYNICKKHDMKFEVEELEFEDRSEVLAWIYENQRGRRNWSPERESYVRGKVYNETKKKPGGQVKAAANVEPQSTSERIGKDAGVSGKSVQRDGKFAAAVDRVAAVAPELKSAILEGKSPVTKGAIQKLADASPEEVEKVVDQIKSGKLRKAAPATSEVLFAKLEAALGSTARMCDELGTRHPGSKYYIDSIQTLLGEALALSSEWQDKFNEVDEPAEHDGYDFLESVATYADDGEFH